MPRVDGIHYESGEVFTGGEIELRLYVITVNYHSEPHLRRLVASLNAVDFVQKLVVVNHSSGERLEELHARFPIQVIHQPNRGYGAGLNRGLQEVKDPNGLVLLCNPDIVILNHQAIEDVWRYMNDNPNVGLVMPALVDGRMRPIWSCRKFYSLTSLLLVSNPWLRGLIPRFCHNHYCVPGLERRPQEVDWGSGSAILVHGSVGNDGPLFDERFFLYFEDVDVCARMWRENRQVVFFPDLVCQHFESRLSHKKVRYFVIHLNSLLKFILKYKGLPQRAELRGLARTAESERPELGSLRPEKRLPENWGPVRFSERSRG
jgi:GT2 family glycosyltransferase